MPEADTDAGLSVVSCAAGRMRLHLRGLRSHTGRATAIEQAVAAVAGVRDVRAYPRSASVVVWYRPRECNTAAVMSAIADTQDLPAAPTGAKVSQSPLARHGAGPLSRVVGGLAQSLLDPQRESVGAPPEIERLRTALDRFGYYPAPVATTTSLVGQLERVRIHVRSRWTWLAVPLGLAVVGFAGVGIRSLRVWAAGIGWQARRSQRVGRRSAVGIAAMTTSALAVPSWGGVVVSLLLVTVAGAIAYRNRLGLTRELVVAGARASVQLITAGALLRVVFQRPGLLGPFSWLLAMIAIAGQVGGRRSALPGARVAATSGVAASTVVTLGTLLAGRVITPQGRVIVPVGGMIVSSAMLAAGSSLRRLDQELSHSRPAVEARLSLGQSGHDAILPHQRSALRTALIPAIDSTKVVGLISLPGAMTGLILAGVSPLTAIRYQIVVMYMQLATSALSALVAVRVAEGAVLDDAHRLIPLNQTDGPR